MLQLYRISLVVSAVQCILLNDPQAHSSTTHEDIPKLNLLQVSHGIYQASVDGGGVVDALNPMVTSGSEAARQAVVPFDADLKPSALAFDEAEGEDMESMHLLQTSRDVMPSSEAEVEADIHAMANESSLPALGSEAPDTIVLGPKDARESTIVLSTEPVVSAGIAAQGSDPAVDGSLVDHPMLVGSEESRSPELEAPTADASAEEKVPAEKKHANAKLSEVDHTLPQESHPSSGGKSSVHDKGSALESHASAELASNSTVGDSPHPKKSAHHGMLGHVYRMRSKFPLHAQNSMSDTVLAFLVLGFFIGILLLLIVGSSMIGRWFLSLYRYSEEKNLRQHIEGMRRSPGLEVVNQLIASSVHDSAICRPLASKQLIRLEARVEEAASGFCLWTPLTQQACVRFNATVSRHDKHARLPVPLSYQCSSIDFVISLLDAPHVRIEIEGRHLSTFDMTAGRMSAKRTFDSAARHWQEFAITSQIGGKALPASRFRSEHSVLEFQETALVLGTRITVIGELHKNAVGTLLLRPSVEDASENSSEPWRTSWESTGVNESGSWISLRNPLSATRKAWLGKVWVSDDPTLLDKDHKHAKYDPVSGCGIKSKPSRDCSTQFADGVVNLIAPNGM